MTDTVAIPQYAKPVASAGGEIVMSTPSWYGKTGAHTAVLVDARRWPPVVTRLSGRIAAAARLPSGTWMVTAKHDNEPWQVCWHTDIGAATPLRHALPPFTIDHAPAADPDDAPTDDGPFAQLVALGDLVLAVPDDLGTAHRPHVYVYRDGAWQTEPALPVRERGNRARVVRFADGRDVLEWNGGLYTADGFRPLDARGCTQLVRAGGGVFAVHDRELVELAEPALRPRLPGHEIYALEAGPGDTLFVTLARDGDRGTLYDYTLFDPAAGTVALLPPELVGAFPKLATSTEAGDLVLHDDREHALVRCTAAELATLPRIAASELAIPPRRVLDILDERGAASRPLVATSGDRIVIALGAALRFHAVDAPRTIVELAAPVVGIAADGRRVAALDATGVLHLHDLDGRHLASRPAGARARSLGVAADGTWMVVDDDRVVLVDDRATRTLDVARPLAVAADPDGGLVIACEERGLVHWTGDELRDLPPTSEQLVAVAALGGGRFACAGERYLYLLDLALPELVALDRRLRRPHLATRPDRGWIAYCPTPGNVQIERFADGTLHGGLTSVHYSKYSEPTSDEVTVHGLAFLPDGRLAIALDAGRANLVHPETADALKLDEHPGDRRARWVFLCGGQILIAG